MRDVIVALGVMPFQLMPSVWKLICAIDNLCVKHHLEITLQDLMNCYSVRTVGKGRVSFRVLSADGALITNLDSGDDKNWVCRFLFINKASLGEGFEYIHDHFAAKPADWVATNDDVSLARLTAFRNLGIKERTWPRALCMSPAAQFNPAKFQVASVVSSPGEVKMMEAEKSESGNQIGGSKGTVIQEASSSVRSNRVSARTRGKGKLAYVSDELEALRKRVKIEAAGSKNTPIEIPATVEHNEPMMESPIPSPGLAALSPDTLRIKKVLKSLSLYKAERDFCEGSSSGRSEEIAESVVELAEAGALDMDYDSMVKRSVFAYFQALYFSSAVARARWSKESEMNELKAVLSKATGDLDHEKAAHGESLLELSKTKFDLQMLQNAFNALVGEMTQALNKVSILERESKDAAVQYTLMARINMMMESEDVRASWDVNEEIKTFKLKFPESNLEDWGVSEVEDSPSAKK